MAGRFTFELVTPERVLLSEEVEQVLVPGMEGDFTVLAGHAPLVSTLRPGVLEVGAGAKRRILVKNGFAEVGPDRLTILAQFAVDAAELKGAQLATAVKDAEAELSSAKDDHARTMAHELVDSLKRLSAAA